MWVKLSTVNVTLVLFLLMLFRVISHRPDESVTQDPVLAQDSYYKVNARIQLASYDETWSVAILGKNLTDEETTTWGNDVPLGAQGFDGTYFQHIDAPRSFEIQARYRF